MILMIAGLKSRFYFNCVVLPYVFGHHIFFELLGDNAWLPLARQCLAALHDRHNNKFPRTNKHYRAFPWNVKCNRWVSCNILNP